MFENITEKGLFTFYWEEAQNQNKNTHQETVQQQTGKNKNTGYKKGKVDMEENKTLSSSTQRHNKTKTMDLRPTQSHTATLHQKQNRQYLLPKTLNISSKLAQSLQLYLNKSRQQKLRKTRKKDQIICKLPHLKYSISQQQSQNQLKHSASSLIEKLTFKEQNSSMKQLAIKIQEEYVKSPKQERVLFGKKTKKLNTQRTKRQKTDNKMSGDFITLQMRNKNKNPKQLLILSPRTLKKRFQKNSYILQKLMVQKMQGKNGRSSVINIGATRFDQYKQRWQKRKQQFLNILAKNMLPVK